MAWFCDGCGTEIAREEWDTAERLPQEGYWQACQSFNASLERRTCLGCGHPWQPLFDIATLLWTELTNLARSLIEEVDALASAYGWSERDILALGGRRRRAYLELAG